MKARIHLFVYGLVQGVFFRANTQEKANSLGLTGWVKNNSDGSVELTAEGDKEKLEELLDFCNKGPESSKVSSVKKEWKEYKGEFKNFEVRH